MAFAPGTNSQSAAVDFDGADFTDSRRDTGEDHFGHAPGRICKNCDQPIEASQPARRRGADDWIHDVCPVVID
jgi:hypothetical protein